MNTQKLRLSEVRKILENHIPNPGKKGLLVSRLIALFDQGNDNVLNYETVKKELFSESDSDPARKFKDFRYELNTELKSRRINLAIAVDRDTRLPDSERKLWFTGEDQTLLDLAELSQANANSVDPSKTVEQDAFDIIKQKPLVKIFLSYAHKDFKIKKDFTERLETVLQASRNYKYEIWQDIEILPGERWEEEIQASIEACDIGILLVSLNFITSGFIIEKELPKFIRDSDYENEPRYPVLVGLGKVDFQNDDLHGIEKRQVYVFSTDSGDKKCFSQCRGDTQKEKFARGVRDAIEKLIDRKKILIDQLPDHADTKRQLESDLLPIEKQPEDTDLICEIEQRMKGNIQGLKDHVDSKGRLLNLKDSFGNVENKRPAPTDSEKIQDRLSKWALNSDSKPYFALLGELGMGKTVNCQLLTLSLLERRKKDSSIPLPIYLDLRKFSYDGGDIPNTETIIQNTLRNSWGSTSTVDIPPGEILKLIRENGAILIFDGLDEKIVHMNQNKGREFMRKLWHALPPNEIEAYKKGQREGKTRGKLLISCRSHYFRSIVDQNSMFNAEGRDKMDVDYYDAYSLLPFDDEQIHLYLNYTFEAKDVERILQLLKSIHNLEELATRPLTLSYIREQIPELEARQLRGETVYGVTLYELMVEKWLDRDDGKHRFGIAHKKRLMESLAFDMWVSGERIWGSDKLDEWLQNYLVQNQTVQLVLQRIDLQELQEDFRTATFIIREGNQFRFAHTSLLEYFLACWMHRSLVENRVASWENLQPSVETLDFLGQLISFKDTSRCLRNLEDVFTSYRKGLSEFVFRFALMCYERDYSTPSMIGMDLHGADLEGIRITGKSAEAPLQLNASSFSGAALSKVVFKNVNLASTDFSGADLSNAEFNRCALYSGRFEKTVLTGSTFRKNNLTGSSFTEADCYETRWIGNEFGDTGLPPEQRCISHIVSVEALKQNHTNVRSAHFRMSENIGHSDWVMACAFSPDGQFIASASSDNAVKIWNVKSAQCIHSLKGHSDKVYGCAFSPDGRFIASASEDNTVKIWDAKSARCLRSLEGHSGSVMACAFSPDSQFIASASSDHTVKIWDAKSAQCIHSLHGHGGCGVNACAFSPDGQFIASASDDNTLKIWDVKSAQYIHSLSGHGGRVNACAFSPDGQCIASASFANTVKIWDAKSAQCLHSLKGHYSEVKACAFSPDGQCIASASRDNTVKIWDVKSAQCLHSLEGHSGWVMACAFSPDSQSIASASDDGTVKIWNAKSARCIHSLESHSDKVYGCAFSPDGQFIASASEDNTVKIWDVKSAQCLRSLKGHSAWVNACAFSPDGRFIASASEDNTVKIWNVKSAQCLRSLEGHSGSVRACAFSPDGQFIASASHDHTVKIWNVKSAQYIHSLEGRPISRFNACAFSPDGQSIASASIDMTIKIWNVKSAQCIHSLEGHSNSVNACAFSPDSQSIASASEDNTVKIWNVKSAQCLHSLKGHSNSVNACAFSPDGQFIASASDDHTLKIWNAKSAQCIHSLYGHSGSVNACIFSPDGQSIVSASDDGTVKIWDMDSQTSILDFLMLPNSQYAVIDQNKNFRHASPEAWRYFSWTKFDEDLNRLRAYPVEMFSYLPNQE